MNKKLQWPYDQTHHCPWFSFLAIYNRDCAKSSDIDVIMFLEMGSLRLSVEKMLCIRVFDFALIQEGDVI